MRADVRRRGHGSTLMTALEVLAARAHDLVALADTDEGARAYAPRGWLRCRGDAGLTPDGVVRTEENHAVLVLPSAWTST